VLIGRDGFAARTLRAVAVVADGSPALGIESLVSDCGLRSAWNGFVGERIPAQIEHAAGARQKHHVLGDERRRAEMLARLCLGAQYLIRYLVATGTPEGRVAELQRRFPVPAVEAFTQGLCALPEVPGPFRGQVPRDDDARVGTPRRPRHTEPNAPAGDPPGCTAIEQGSSSQPAA
jgi:hypothetical protein